LRAQYEYSKTGAVNQYERIEKPKIKNIFEIFYDQFDESRVIQEYWINQEMIKKQEQIDKMAAL
jgi:hypothetical protein